MKNKNLKTRYFLISFLITFTIVTLVGVFSFFSGENRDVLNTHSDIPKTYSPNKVHDITVLLIGQGENSRAYSLLKFSAEDMVARIISIPSEMKIENESITQIQSFGGAEFLLEKLGEYLNVKIDRFVKINSRAFKSALDSMGSVYLTTENDIHYYAPDGFSFALSKGEHILPAEKVYNVMRFDTQGGEELRLNGQSEILCKIINQKLCGEEKINETDFFNLIINVVDSNVSVFDFDKRLEAVKHFLKNGKAVAESVNITEDFSLSDECREKISLLF